MADLSEIQSEKQTGVYSVTGLDCQLSELAHELLARMMDEKLEMLLEIPTVSRKGEQKERRMGKKLDEMMVVARVDRSDKRWGKTREQRLVQYLEVEREKMWEKRKVKMRAPKRDEQKE